MTSPAPRTEQEVLDELLEVTRKMAEHGKLCEELDAAYGRAREAAEKAGEDWDTFRQKRSELLKELDRVVYPGRGLRGVS